jgi:hypothetical protein
MSRRRHRPTERPRRVAVRQCHRRVTRSARRVHVDPTAGIGREVAGDGMAVVGFGCPGDGAELGDPATAAEGRRWRCVSPAHPLNADRNARAVDPARATGGSAIAAVGKRFSSQQSAARHYCPCRPAAKPCWKAVSWAYRDRSTSSPPAGPHRRRCRRRARRCRRLRQLPHRRRCRWPCR